MLSHSDSGPPFPKSRKKPTYSPDKNRLKPFSQAVNTVLFSIFIIPASKERNT